MMQGSEWITHCDRCKRPVRVSISQQERASTPLYCERCFENLPQGQDDLAPPAPEHFEMPSARAPVAPPLPPQAPQAANVSAGSPQLTLDEARRIVREAEEKVKQGQEVFVTCEVCSGTGRVPLVLGG